MKYILPISLLISIINFYTSFFLISECSINRGVVFGIEIPYVIYISIFLLLVILLLIFKTGGNIQYIFLGIFVFGLGNFLEKIVRGYICDYIYLFNISVNLVDIGITILVVLGILTCILNKDGDSDCGGKYR